MDQRKNGIMSSGRYNLSMNGKRKWKQATISEAFQSHRKRTEPQLLGPNTQGKHVQTSILEYMVPKRPYQVTPDREPLSKRKKTLESTNTQDFNRFKWPTHDLKRSSTYQVAYQTSKSMPDAPKSINMSQIVHVIPNDDQISNDQVPTSMCLEEEFIKCIF